ncbi:MAG: DegV family protein [Chloroflexota bacterium]|nr:MAG: DegV family protein [Chloroflexota bacterium]
MGKKKVAIATDSVANIPVGLIEEYDIKVIPQCLNWVGKTYLDGIDITTEEFYQRLASAKELPTTSQPSAGEFREFFLEVAEGCDSIVCIVVSDHLSGTLDSANAAVKMIPDFPIEVVDSRSASMGQGFIVLAAANAAGAGKSYAEVAELARGLVPGVRAVFVVDTLEFLHRGGRIGGARRLLGSVLSIKPLLHLVNGQIEPLANVRTKRKALERALEIIEEDTAGKGPLHAAVLHASTPDEAEKFYVAVEGRLQPVELLLTELTPVVGTHTGPGLVGLAYYNES